MLVLSLLLGRTANSAKISCKGCKKFIESFNKVSVPCSPGGQSECVCRQSCVVGASVKIQSTNKWALIRMQQLISGCGLVNLPRGCWTQRIRAMLEETPAGRRRTSAPMPTGW